MWRFQGLPATCPATTGDRLVCSLSLSISLSLSLSLSLCLSVPVRVCVFVCVCFSLWECVTLVSDFAANMTFLSVDRVSGETEFLSSGRDALHLTDPALQHNVNRFLRYLASLPVHYEATESDSV